MQSRAGTVDYGRIYEQKMAALVAIRCALDPTVANFWIVSNVDGFEAFDDIVLSIENTDGSRKLYCIQLKHVENGTLQTRQLTSNKGNFSIDKYHNSYKTIKENVNKFELIDVDFEQTDFVLYTNAPLSGKLDVITLENKKSFDIINTSSDLDTVFQVSNFVPEEIFEDDFLQRFSIYTSQASATALDRLIKNEIDSYFEGISNTVIVTITDYFIKWSLGKKEKFRRIFKKDVQMKLLECLLQPQIIKPIYHTQLEEIKCKLLNDTLTNFNVTPIICRKSLDSIFASVSYTLQETYDMYFTSEASWNSNLTQEQYELLKRQKDERQVRNVLKVKSQYLPQLTILDLYLAAWQCNIVPLLVDYEVNPNLIKEILFKFEEVTKDLSFVLCFSEEIKEFKGNLSVFNNFNDIDDVFLLNRNLEKMCVSLQGKESLSLKELKNVDVLSEITPDVYLILLSEVMQIGEICEIDNYYIKRVLKRPCLSFNVLEKNNVLKTINSQPNYFGNLFVIVEFRGDEYIPYKYDNDIMDFATYAEKCTSGKVNQEKYILTSNLKHTDKLLAESIANIQLETKKAIHVVKLHKYFLQWLFSEGPIDALQDYIDETIIPDYSDEVEEDDILKDSISDVNIISNNAGMGKTFMLKSLANKFESDQWVCFINLSEHLTKLTEIIHPEKFIEYIIYRQIVKNDKLVQKLCTEIFRNCNSGNIVWLLDGYDEVSQGEFLPFLKYIKEGNMKIWITTRPTYKKKLEEALETLSIEIAHFRNDDQATFIWKYFQTFTDLYDFNKEQIQEIISTVSQYGNSLDNSLISIPLQTRMLTEIFGDDISQIKNKNKFAIIDLYNRFVDVKLKEYKSYEATSLRKTLSKLALKLFYTEDQLEELLDFEELAEEALTFQESYRKDSIVIGLNEKGDAVFGHRSFAEFLAAQWLTKQIITKKKQFNQYWIPLVEKLFYVDILPVRAFFDRILCQNLPLHLAVLNNDIDTINILLKDESIKSSLDCLGRSALHLAVSYGKYYDLHVHTEITGLRSLGLHTYINEFSDGCILEVPILNIEHQISTTVLDNLLSHGLLNKQDHLFHYDAFDYAMKSCSLDALDCLYKTLEKDSLLFGEGFNFKVFLYCIVWDNLHNILSYRKKYNFDTLDFQSKLRKMFVGYNNRLLNMKYNGFYLTELASFRGSKEILFELLQTGQLSVHDGFPVHKACFSGYSEIIELLFKMGADIKKCDTFGWNPTRTYFLKSNRNIRTDITYHFFKDSKYDNKETSMTPMHYACQRGHVECVIKLIELGASVVEIDGYGNTPLYYASLYGYINCIEVMVNSLSKEGRQDKNVQSILNTLASKGYSVKSLIPLGLNVNYIDENGDTPLILASRNGFPNVIRELAEFKDCNLNFMKPNESLKNICERPVFNMVESLIKWALNLNDDSTLSMPTTKNSSSMVSELMQLSLANSDQQLIQTRKTDLFNYILKFLSLGVDQEGKTDGGMSALHFAVIEGHLDCVKALIEVGADQNIEDTVGLGYSPVIWAAMKGYSDIVEFLSCTETNAESCQRRREDVEVALIWASILGFDACVTVLLRLFPNIAIVRSSRNEERIEDILRREYGSYYDEAVRPFGNVTNVPLIVATINKHTSVIQLLTSEHQLKEDLNIALFWASKQGDLETVKVLVESGANENVATEKNLKVLPIVWGSMYGHTEVIDFFLIGKSDDYIKNKDVSMALNFAAAKGHYNCVKLLLDSGADINNICNELMEGTPILNACQYEGTPEIIEELLSKNCDVNVKNSEGMSLLDFLAKKRMYCQVKRVLGMGVYQDQIVDENSVIYSDLQLALDWAIDNDENEMIYQFVELGVRRNDDKL